MFNTNYSIAVFLKETGDGVSFPFQPEQLLDDSNNYDLYWINCNTSTPDQITHVAGTDFVKYGGVHTVTASAIHSCRGSDGRRIYTVHPNNIILPLYKWYLLKNANTCSDVDQYVQRLSRVTVDICEAFHKPMVLTLDRRQNFNYMMMARWLGLENIPPGMTPSQHCINTLKFVCQRL